MPGYGKGPGGKGQMRILLIEDDRVIAEARSVATLIDGQAYAQTYVFAMRIRDGRIAHIAEHYNALETQEKLMPLMAKL